MIDDDLRISTTPFYLHREVAELLKGFVAMNGQEGLNWEVFREAFLKEFFHNTWRERKQSEFTNLLQRKLIV